MRKSSGQEACGLRNNMHAQRQEEWCGLEIRERAGGVWKGWQEGRWEE